MCELYFDLKFQMGKNISALKEFKSHGAEPFGNTDGWGIGFVSADGDMTLTRGLKQASLDPTWPTEPEGNTKITTSHIREASEGGVVLENCQPFVRQLGRTRVVFAHNGECPGLETSPEFKTCAFSPVGTTDSEVSFALLLGRLADINCKDPRLVLTILLDFARDMAERGPANLIVSVGEWHFIFADVRKPVGEDSLQEPGLYLKRSESQLLAYSEPLQSGCVPVARGAWYFADAQSVLQHGTLKLDDRTLEFSKA